MQKLAGTDAHVELLATMQYLGQYLQHIHIEKDATSFLPHKCSKRCLKRIAFNSNENDYIHRKPNNSKISEDLTKHTYMKLNND